MSRALRSSALYRSQFYRLYYIDRQVRAGRYPNAPRLAAELEVGQRSVERDLEYLRDMLGAPLVYDPRHRGYYYTQEFSLPPLSLTEGELVAVFLAQKLLAELAGTPLEEPVRSAFAKIQYWLPESVTLNADLWDQVLSFHLPPLRGDEKEVALYYLQLMQAIREHKSVLVHYYTASRGELTERRLDPYHVFYHEGAWYLAAYCHLRRAVQTFGLDRLRAITVLEQRFQRQPGFSPQAYLRDAFGIERGQTIEEVVIRFDQQAARFVRERRWHESQQMEEHPDGSLMLRLRVSGLGQVKRWVLSYGPHAELLAPAGLREEIARDVHALAAKYTI